MNPDALRQLLRREGTQGRDAVMRKLEKTARQTFKVRAQGLPIPVVCVPTRHPTLYDTEGALLMGLLECVPGEIYGGVLVAVNYGILLKSVDTPSCIRHAHPVNGLRHKALRKTCTVFLYSVKRDSPPFAFEKCW